MSAEAQCNFVVDNGPNAGERCFLNVGHKGMHIVQRDKAAPQPAAKTPEQDAFRKLFIAELYRRHGNCLGSRSIDELADFVQRGWNAAIEAAAQLFEKAFEQAWVVQDTLDAIRSLRPSPAPDSAKPDATQSRSVQRRIALQKGEPMPKFASGGMPLTAPQQETVEMGQALDDDPVKCGCDEFPECTHSLYWYQGFKAGMAHQPPKEKP